MVWLKRDAFNRHDEQAPAAIPPASLAPPHDAVDLLCRFLSDGGYAVGARLPAERQLAANLGMGRPSVREAIKALVAKGRLQSRRGSGTYVISLEPAADPVASSTPDFRLCDLLEYRTIVEPKAASLAALRATETQRQAIDYARQKWELHDRDWKLAWRMDMEFHASIVRAAGNPALAWAHQRILDSILNKQKDRVNLVPEPEKVRAAHRLVTRAILNRQAGAAAQAMLEHLHSAEPDWFTGGAS